MSRWQSAGPPGSASSPSSNKLGWPRRAPSFRGAAGPPLHKRIEKTVREYTIKTPAGEATVQLSDADAEARGLLPAKKARTVENKAAEEAPAEKPSRRAAAAKAAFNKK